MKRKIRILVLFVCLSAILGVFGLAMWNIALAALAGDVLAKLFLAGVGLSLALCGVAWGFEALLEVPK